MPNSDHFELLINGQRIRAELLDREAPGICRAFRACLPLETFVVHAKFAGDELIAMVPFFSDLENQVASVAPGDIGYYPTRQTLCLFYGETMPFASVSLFARVVSEDLPIAQAAGRDVLAAGMRPLQASFARAKGAPSGDRATP